MRFDRISLLVDQLKTPLGEMGWFHSSTSAVAQQGQGQAQGQAQGVEGQQTKVKQSGVVRSNCMDCLDRTNVSQSALGKWAATEQLRSVGVLNEKEKIEDFPEFMDMFRAGMFVRPQLYKPCTAHTLNNRCTVIALPPPSRLTPLPGNQEDQQADIAVWADHGDTVSRAYSGTGALKADYTRTGKRTKEGMAHDGYKSVMRYVTNNFMDGDRQVRFACNLLNTPHPNAGTERQHMSIAGWENA
jgi:hypothetical protein